MLDETGRLIYLAGMMDADGSIDLRLKKAGNMLLRAQVYNSNIDLMEWLKLHFGGAVILVERRDMRAHLWKPGYQWYLNGQFAASLLRQLEPFMIVKRARAQLAIEAWEKRDPTPVSKRRRPLKDGLLEQRQEYVERMRLLNKKGA